MSRNKGFTLLEVLIALALLATLSAALYATYFSVMRGREKATDVMARQRELRTTLDTLRRELSAALYRSEPGDQKKRLRFVLEDRDFFGKPASILTFTTISPPRAVPVSDQTEVRYQPLQRDGHMILAKQEKDLYSEKDPLTFPQMENIEAFLVECSKDGAKWVRTWDTALDPSLPKAVRVTITVRDGDKPYDFVTIATPRMNQ